MESYTNQQTRKNNEETYDLKDILEPQEEFIFDDWQDSPVSAQPKKTAAVPRPSFKERPAMPFSSAFLNEEEEEKRERFKLYGNIAKLISIFIGAAAILLMTALLSGLFHWIGNEISHSSVFLFTIM